MSDAMAKFTEYEVSVTILRHVHKPEVRDAYDKLKEKEFIEDTEILTISLRHDNFDSIVERTKNFLDAAVNYT